MKRARDEYGGFLPLELNPGKEYYEQYGKKVINFNCAKAAVAYVLDKVKINNLYIPYYLCPNVCAELEKHDIAVSYYHVNEKLQPEGVELHAHDAIYLVDYFGIMDKKVDMLVKQFSEGKVIIDNCHAFFHEPIMRKNVYNIYSAKKIIGVPDGAYLITEEFEEENQSYSNANSYAGYLLGTYEQGTNMNYEAKKCADRYIGEHYGPMSILANGILCNVDYNRIQKCRKENCVQYNQAFKEMNRVRIEDDSIPYVFPLLLGNNGEKIKKLLIEEKIYVSTLWNGDKLLANGNEFEQSMAHHTLFLPLDQRYNKEDIDFIIERLMEKI